MYEALTFSLAIIGLLGYLRELDRAHKRRLANRSDTEKVFQWRKETAIERARAGYSTIIDS